VNPLVAKGIKLEEIIAFNLGHNDNGKTPVTKIVKPWIEKLEKPLFNLGIKHVLIAEPNYFKTICKERKADPHYGYQKQTIWPGIVGYITSNYKALMFNAAIQAKIDMSLAACSQGILGGPGLFAKKALEKCYCPETLNDISRILDQLKERPAVSIDIEGYSLRVDKAKIATIAFGLDTKSAVAFPVGQDQHRKEVLKNFFMTYEGGKLFHNCTYDVKVIIWELFMKHPTDYVGMLQGLHVMFRNLHDTKALAYLALNSCSDISLGLKDLAFEHTGNYAQDDIQDITKIPLDELLEYNATDTIATWYVYDKYRQQVKDEQEFVYQEVFQPTLKTLTQMELCGTPINMGAVLNAEQKMDDIRRTHFDAVMNDPVIKDFEWMLRDKEAEKANLKLKKLRKTRDDFKQFRFNPNSDTQLAVLLHEYWDLPVLEKTDSGLPSTKNSVLRALVERVRNSRKWSNRGIGTLLEHICELHEVSKILNTFIPAFKSNSIPKDGWHYLHGGFNLGGTKSGRLSSSEPNLQNIPSTGTQYAKLIKACFQPPLATVKGQAQEWIFVGADYASLEDRISALLTKDPNKLAVYTDGYDGHCLRAYYYFREHMPDVTAEIEAGRDRVEAINSIEERYPKLRQHSKGPTFALTYMGTWRTLVKTFGLKQEVAQAIEDNYHDLYSVADKWVMDRLEEASKTGYVELAFGLRLRTPLLTKVVFNSASMPFQAHQEMKTAGNALGQSYGLLNSHSANLFMKRVWDSEYRYSVFPCMQVHDSQYYMVRNTVSCLKWVNDNLIECMEWNQLPPIQHPDVGLGATLELYHRNWAEKLTIPNRASKLEIQYAIKWQLMMRKIKRTIQGLLEDYSRAT
jgi:DNA polymerase-1